MPGVLVRSAREPAARPRLDPQAVPAHWRTGLGQARAALDRSEVPPLRIAPAPDPRPSAQHAVSVLALRSRARTVDHLFQFPAREELHPPALAAAARGA